MNKALELLKTSITVAQRAESYATSMKRNIQRDVLDTIISKKEKIERDLFDLKDFSLGTDVNAGVKKMTQEECESRFKKIIDLEYELQLTELELKVKQASFDTYFKEQ